MGILYVDTGGNAANSGSTDNASADVTLTVHASYAGGTTVQITVNTGSLASVVTSGATQSTVNFPDATNASSQDIFWITAVDDVASPKTITVSVAPTGLTAGTSTGRIGGWYVSPGTNVASVMSAALRAGDIMQFNNTPAVKTNLAFVTSTSAGDSTSGRITVRGKTGVRPVLEVSGNVSPITTSASNNWYISNLELKSAGTAALLTMTSGSHVDNVKFTGTGGSTSQHGITVAGYGTVSNCEMVVGGSGISHSTNGTGVLAFGNYIHGCGVDGFTDTSLQPCSQLIGNTITANTGRGIYASAASTTQTGQMVIVGNTIYGNTLAGIEVLDADTAVIMFNNIVMSTGAGDIVKWAAGNGQNVSVHGYNVLYGSSSGTLTNYTASATELTTNPGFTNAAGGDFSISSSSPAAGAGYPGTLAIAGGTTGYRDIGAFQRQVTAGGGVVGVIGS